VSQGKVSQDKVLQDKVLQDKVLQARGEKDMAISYDVETLAEVGESVKF
jgi:hypothetical protein